MMKRRSGKPFLILLLTLVILFGPACSRGRASRQPAPSESRAGRPELSGWLRESQTPIRFEQPDAPRLPPPYRVGIVWLDKPELLSPLEFESQSRVLAADVKRSRVAYQVFSIPSSISVTGDDIPAIRELGRRFQAHLMLILSTREDTRRRLNAAAFGYLTVIGAAVIPGDTTSKETLIEAFALEPQSGVFLFTATGAGKATRAGSMLTLRRNRKWVAAKAFEEAAQDLANQINKELVTLAEQNRADSTATP